MSSPNEDLIEAIAVRVVELLVSRGLPLPTGDGVGGSPRVLTCRQAAELLGRSTDWVREHRRELGQIPGEGQRPRLLFDAEAVERWATARDGIVRSEPSPPPVSLASRRRGSAQAPASAPLLPVRTPGARRAA